MRDLRYMMVVAVAAAGLALAGCGSGGPSQSELNEERQKTEEQAAMVAQLQNQINALRAQLNLAPADDLSDSITDLQGQVTALQGQIDAAEEAARMAAEEAARKAAEEAAAAMAVTATKLYAGIVAPSATAAAAYGTGANEDDIVVTLGTATATLSEDEDATVPARYGWAGMMFTETVELADDNTNAGSAGMYEAVVYSNVGEPTEGAKFSATYTYNARPVDGTNTELTIDGTDTAVQARIASPSFDQSAGKKEFKLGTNAERVMLSGSYHGVSGYYWCAPAAGETCSSTVAASGFALGNGTWTFKATDPETRLMDVADNVYASYGWWIRKSADDKTYNASAFAALKGAVPAATGVTALQGTATYMGGAAGKYALSSTTGGTNDAGHFTARATLEADFGDDMITGTIDNFMGADGMARPWSVKLNEADLSDGGVIDGQNASSEEYGTVWTIDGKAADAAGQWRGNLYENDATSGVPQVATGTFHSTYGRAGQMVGAFGANEQ